MLREGLQRLAGWRLKAMGGWRRPKTLVIDIDSLPAEVHGEQPGSAWNGYYHRRVYHPVVAAAGETGDILDLRLREGQVHTADGGLEFVLEVLERAERHLCGKAAARFDAGYPGEPLMAALEERGTHYVARVRNNAVLKRLALPAMDAAVWDALSNGVPAGEPRTWVCESSTGPGRGPVPAGSCRSSSNGRRTHPALLLAAGFDALRRPQGRRGVSKRWRKARPSRTTNPFGPETPVFGPRNRPDLPSRVAIGPSAPHLTLDSEVHE